MRLLSAGLVLSLLTGCAGLMMSVNDLDQTKAEIRLSKGDTVAISMPEVENIKDNLSAYKKDQTEFAKDIVVRVTAELTKSGITVDPSSKNNITIDMMKYDNGCGFCRGFFPMFGLGNSYFDGKVTLKTANKARSIMIEKVGHSSGTATMGDPTKTNLNYFATVLVNNLVSGADAKMDEK